MESIKSAVFEGGKETLYLLIGGLVIAYAKGLFSKWFSNMSEWADWIAVGISVFGVMYFKNGIMKNISQGALVVSMLGLVKKYFGFGVL